MKRGSKILAASFGVLLAGRATSGQAVQAQGGISFVALPNAGLRVVDVRTSREVLHAGQLTPFFLRVEPGIYRVELTFPGARPASRDVAVEAGRTMSVHVEDPRFDVEKLVGTSVPESEARTPLGNGARAFFRGDYDGCVKILTPLADGGNAVARLFTAYAMAGSVLAGGRETSPEVSRARALYGRLAPGARPTDAPGVSPRILDLLRTPVVAPR